MEKRQQLYPYEDPENNEYYIGRYTLLTCEWRMSEVYRFAVLTSCDENLFPMIYSQGYDAILIRMGRNAKFRSKARSSKQENRLTHLYTTYQGKDTLFKNRRLKGDRDLSEMSDTLSTLPEELQKHPPNWSTYILSHEPPTFTELVKQHVEVLITEEREKYQVAQQQYAADRARIVKGETIPILENDDNKASTTTSSIKNELGVTTNTAPTTSLPILAPSIISATTLSSSIPITNFDASTLPLLNTSVTAAEIGGISLIPDIKLKLNTEVVTTSTIMKDYPLFTKIFQDTLLGDTIRQAIMLELKSLAGSAGTNRFVDKAKKLPEPSDLFDGAYNNLGMGPTILSFILVNILRFKMNMTEANSLIEKCFKGSATLWLNNLKTQLYMIISRCLCFT